MKIPANPQARNPKAVLYCMGAKVGFIWTRKSELVCQPNRTVIPSTVDMRLQAKNNLGLNFKGNFSTLAVS
jgi:hypothetical protein